MAKNIDFNAKKTFPKITFWLNTHMVFSNAVFSSETLWQNTPVNFNGIIDINKKILKLSDFNLTLGDMGLNLEGSVDRNRELDLKVNFLDSKNSFFMKGPLNNPRIHTYWNGVKTEFSISGIRYENGQLILPRIIGEINLEGLSPIDMEGGLCISKDYICFNKFELLNAVRLSGEVYRDKKIKLKLFVEDIMGAEIGRHLPDALKVFILPHKIKADFNIFGELNAVQAGGLLKLSSEPLEIACRYRNKKFLFRSIGEGALKISGVMDWNKSYNIKIKGLFNQMNIRDFMALLGKETSDKWGGTINGRFEISGDMASPQIDAEIDMKEADFGSVKFDVAYLNITGIGSGPLNLENSSVYYKGIPADLTGYIDPKGDNIFKNIEIHPTGESFIWEGINISKDVTNKIVTFEKDVDGNVSIRFKSLISSNPEEAGVERKPGIEVEYKIRDDKNLLLKMEEEEGTVGVEHKVKF